MVADFNMTATLPPIAALFEAFQPLFERRAANQNSSA
jgi:hypothetical protein